jgi:hypothetical protein
VRREAVVAEPYSVAVFDALHRRGRVTDAILQAFDLVELDGEDLRPLPLGKRKERLARLLARARVTDENGRRGVPAPHDGPGGDRVEATFGALLLEFSSPNFTASQISLLRTCWHC